MQRYDSSLPADKHKKLFRRKWIKQCLYFDCEINLSCSQNKVVSFPQKNFFHMVPVT